MDKEELKQDLVRDKIIGFIEYLSENSSYVLTVVIFSIMAIYGYSFTVEKKLNEFNLSSELSGLAQTEYNQGDVEFAVDDLQGILDDYESTHGGTQAYIYLIYNAYINDDNSTLNSLLNNYSIYSKDILLQSSVLETKAYLSMNSDDYSSAIDLLNKSLKLNDIEQVNVRLNISKARVYISKEEYGKAKSLLDELKDNESIATTQKDIIEELISYIDNIKG